MVELSEGPSTGATEGAEEAESAVEVGFTSEVNGIAEGTDDPDGTLPAG